MKPLTFLALLITVVSSCTVTTSSGKRASADSVLVKGSMGTAQISALIKLPADRLDSYRIGQTITCALEGTPDPDRFGTPVFIEDTSGHYTIQIKSLRP